MPGGMGGMGGMDFASMMGGMGGGMPGGMGGMGGMDLASMMKGMGGMGGAPGMGGMGGYDDEEDDEGDYAAAAGGPGAPAGDSDDGKCTPPLDSNMVAPKLEPVLALALPLASPCGRLPSRALVACDQCLWYNAAVTALSPTAMPPCFCGAGLNFFALQIYQTWKQMSQMLRSQLMLKVAQLTPRINKWKCQCLHA